MLQPPNDPNEHPSVPAALPAVSFENEAEADDPENAPKLSLEQVLSAGARDFQSSLGLGHDEALDFERLGEAIHETQSALVAHLLPEGSDPVAAEHEGGDGLDAEYLNAMVRTYEEASGPVDLGSAGADPFHHVSILLHAAHLDAGVDQEALGRAIDSALKDVDRTASFYFIVRAVHDMASHASHTEFDQWMPAALPALRRYATPMIERLDELACASHAHGKAALWPYAVNEMLITLKGRTQGLDPRIHELDEIAIHGAIQRLTALNSIAGRRLANGMFTMEQTFAHGILAELMKTPGRTSVGPVLFTAFKESPPCDRGVSMCMFAHRQYSPELDGLMAEQLKDTRSPVSSQAQSAAAWLLVGTIGSMPASRRDESWVSLALGWLGERDQQQDSDSQRQAITKFLERVVKDRDGIRRAWNKECRQAAKRSLSQGKTR